MEQALTPAQIYDGALAQVQDTLTNLTSGLGTAADKNTANVFGLVLMNYAELVMAFRGDWLCGKIIKIPAQDATREWRMWNAEKEQITALQDEEKRFNVKGKVREALIKARLLGGAAILIGVKNDKNWDQELNLEAIKKGDLEYLNVFDRTEIGTMEIERDMLSPYYGEPKFYTLTGTAQTQKIHPSRVVRFVGNPLPVRSLEVDGWGDSVLQGVNTAVKNAALSCEGIATLINEASVDVIKVPDFMANVATSEYRSRIIERFTLAKISQSIIRARLIDAAEEWETRQINFSNLPQTIQIFLQVAAGAADIPATRLLGASPDGLNATGAGDLRNYYDNVADKQKNELEPALARLDQVLIRSALGTVPPGIAYDWISLWQPTEAEKAATRLSNSQTLANVVNTGLVPSEVLAPGALNMLIEDGFLPGLEQAAEDFEANGGLEENDPEADDQFKKSKGGTEEDPNADPDGKKPKPGDPKGTKDAAPRTLYVCRKVENAKAILAWAKKQGIKGLLPADELHVTIAYSTTPVDWMEMGEAWQAQLKIAAGGPRVVEKLGGALVVLFACSELYWRNMTMRDRGASWDYPTYQPHITVSNNTEQDFAGVEPYTGEIVLGPELFEEINP